MEPKTETGILYALAVLLVIAITYQMGYLNKILPVKWQANFRGTLAHSMMLEDTLHGHDGYANAGMYM